MKKKSLGIQVMPVSPVVRAWALFPCLFDEDRPEGQQNKSCSMRVLLDAIALRSAGDAKFETLKLGVIEPDSLHTVPFLRYGSFSALTSVLGTYGAVNVTPISAGGMLIEVVFDSGSFDLFESLYDAE